MLAAAEGLVLDPGSLDVEAQEAITALLKRFAKLRPGPRGLKYRTIPSFRGLAEYWLLAS